MTPRRVALPPPEIIHGHPRPFWWDGECAHPTAVQAQACLESRGQWWRICDVYPNADLCFIHPGMIFACEPGKPNQISSREDLDRVQREDEAWLRKLLPLLGPVVGGQRNPRAA